ncbi:MAG: hypothetical protein Q8N18_18725 [Opitutaceae bacterium]|nr:hypothetical protein [Opitutaceae bacterium]
MKSLLPTAAIAAMIVTVLVTFCAIVLCLAGGANATPAQVRSLKLWMLGLTLLGGGGVTAGIFLMRAGQHSWAAGAAILPAVIMVLILIVALIIK